MDHDSTPIEGKNEPPQRSSVSVNTLITCGLGVFQIFAGLFLKSSAYLADGINVMVDVPFQMKRKKAVWGYLLCFVFIAVSFLIALSSFFDTASVLDYFKDCASLLTVPAAFLSIVFKVILRMNKKNSGEETAKITFDILISVLIAISVLLTYAVDFYFEPVIAIALATYTFAYSVERFSFLIAEIKKSKIQDISQDTEIGE